MVGKYAARTGYFFVSKYDPVSDGGKRGLVFELTYHPSALLDGCKFGLIQVVTPTKKVADKWELFVNIGGPDEDGLWGNSYVDSVGDRNPLFGMRTRPHGNRHDITNAVSSLNVGGQGRIGECEGAKTTPAYMQDHPTRTFTGTEYKHEFETAAVCIAGPLKGMCLGALTWGYRVDTTGAVHPIAPTSAKQYSDNFRDTVRFAWKRGIKVPGLT
jgi:hypothetical protein